jgi:ribonuclease P protein subunit POP4
MWVGYMQELLGGQTPVTPTAAAKLVSAEFVGAEVQVVRCRCVSRVGVRGIVVKDTRFTFEIVTRKDELKSEFLLFSINPYRTHSYCLGLIIR